MRNLQPPSAKSMRTARTCERCGKQNRRRNSKICTACDRKPAPPELMIMELAFREGDRRRRNGRKPRVYFHLQGETVMENLAKRIDGIRPTASDYRALIPSVLAMANGLHHFENREPYKGATAKWSMKAGCWCPCSPGFILDGADGENDIFVTVKPRPQGVAL